MVHHRVLSLAHSENIYVGTYEPSMAAGSCERTMQCACHYHPHPKCVEPIKLSSVAFGWWYIAEHKTQSHTNEQSSGLHLSPTVSRTKFESQGDEQCLSFLQQKKKIHGFRTIQLVNFDKLNKRNKYLSFNFFVSDL